MSRSEPDISLQMREDEVLPYMKEVYDWAYVKPAHVEQLDRNIVVRVLLFFNDQRMMRAYLDKIKPGSKVWQVAHVYGDLVRKAAQKVGADGAFWLSDATPIQVEHGQRKLNDLPQANVWHSDAAHFIAPEPPDLICSFFLLHEVPEQKKREIVDNMLAQIPADGEALFVDYHRPALWQPIRWILMLVNHFLEPFAMAMWRNEISSYASKPDDFTWEKRTIFGGVYQILSVRHKR